MQKLTPKTDKHRHANHKEYDWIREKEQADLKLLLTQAKKEACRTQARQQASGSRQLGVLEVSGGRIEAQQNGAFIDLAK